MSKLNQIISYISARNPIHTRKLQKNLTRLGETYDRRVEEFLTRYEALLATEGQNLDFATDCYLKMLADITVESLRFRETGEYSSKSFAEVNARVYGNPAVMEYYMHGLLLSQFLTLYTTPVIYIYLSKLVNLRRRAKDRAPEAEVGRLRAAE